MSAETEPTDKQIKNHLERILASSAFRTTGRLSDFLRFVVEETLAGRQHQIKGYTVATKVFGRPADFDPVADPIVRIQAARLRRRLDSYYAEEDRGDRLRIRVPKGGYVPVFSTVDEGGDETRSTEPAPLDSHEGRCPSVAVLPFVGVGSDPQLELLTGGIAEEISSALSGFDGLSVIGRQSTVQYQNSTLPVAEIAGILGARFVVTGSLRVHGHRLRVSVQLTDVADSRQLWADSIERDLSVTGLFDAQDEITNQVVALIGDEYGIILRQVTSEVRRKPPDSLSLYESTLRFYHYNLHPGVETHAKALAALELTVHKAPDYSLAWALLAELYVDAHMLGFDAPENGLDQAHRAAHRATALDPTCQQARSTMAYVHFAIGEYEAAIGEAEIAIALNPNRLYQVAASGFWLGLSGELERGLSIIDDVQRSDRHQPGWLRLVAVIFHLDQEEHAAALSEARRFRSPQLAWDPLLQASTAALAGNTLAAATSLREFDELFPEIAADPAPYIRKYVRADRHVATILEGLERARNP